LKTKYLDLAIFLPLFFEISFPNGQVLSCGELVKLVLAAANPSSYFTATRVRTVDS
jgi:hypothetical protein